MKKIVALVLSLVMVLGLATTAFGAITLWAPNGSTADCDIYDAHYNTKLNDTVTPVDVTFNPGQALKLDKNGDVSKEGVLPHYTMEYYEEFVVTVPAEDLIEENGSLYSFSEDAYEDIVAEVEGMYGFPFVVTVVGDDFEDATGVAKDARGGMQNFEDVDVSLDVEVVADASALFVKVDSVPAVGSSADYFFVKMHDEDIPYGYQFQFAQTAKDPYVILKAVDAVTYYGEATVFTAWSDACEAYAEPVNADTVKYYTVTKGIGTAFAELGGFVAKIPAVDTDEDGMNVLVGGEVVTLSQDVDAWVFATAHIWVASAWNTTTGAVTEFTCTNCKTVGTVINASINAPAGAKIDNVNGVLVAYNMAAVEAPAGDKVESAQTFDAGIAMYVGMSVMAAAGSAVVLKKKD